MKHEFTLILDGTIDEDTLDRLFRAGCDDASFGTVDRVAFAEFHREADTFSQALTSAVAAVESVSNLRVTAVKPLGLAHAS